MQIMRGRSGPFSRSSKLTFIDRLSLIDSFLYVGRGLSFQTGRRHHSHSLPGCSTSGRSTPTCTMSPSTFFPFSSGIPSSMSWLTRGRVHAGHVRRLSADRGAAGPQGGHRRAVEAARTQIQGDRQGRRSQPALRRMAPAQILWRASRVDDPVDRLRVPREHRGDGIEFGALACSGAGTTSLF